MCMNKTRLYMKGQGHNQSMSNFGLFSIFAQMDRKKKSFLFVFEKQCEQKTLEKQKGSFVETKGFFCFSLNKRKLNKSKLNIF